MKLSVESPLLRAPVSIIIDDSTACLNLAPYWLEDNRSGDRSHLPRAIPADFAEHFASWAREEGVRGKFSVIPYPAGVGFVHKELPGHPERERLRWLEILRGAMHENFDITPEMITHTRVVDLETYELTDEWEQSDWANPVEEGLLTDYIARAIELDCEAGVEPEGVTSPGGFGGRMEERYARATLQAFKRTTGRKTPFYFKRIYMDRTPDVPVRFADREAGEAVASIIACTGDWAGGWTGYDLGDVNKFITEDLEGGRLPQVIRECAPAIICVHWPGMYFGGEEKGFDILKEAVRRVNSRGDAVWMKTSEIAHYEMARGFARFEVEGEVEVEGEGEGEAVVVDCTVGCPFFTVRADGFEAELVELEGETLARASEAGSLKEGSFFAGGGMTVVAWRLQPGRTRLRLV